MTIDHYFVTRAESQMPHHPQAMTAIAGSIPPTMRPGLRARAAAHAAFQLGEWHLQNLDAASRYTADDVAPDMLPELREALTRSLQTHLRDAFDNPSTGLTRVGQRALDEADKAAEEHRLRLDPDSVPQMMRTDQAWNNSIRPMLEQGKSWAEVIGSADADGLLAAERFAPGYESRIRDRFHQNEVPAVLDGIREASARRAVEIASPEGRAALNEYEDVTRSAGFTARAMSTLADTTTRNVVQTSISIKRGAAQAGVQQPVATSADAQAGYTAQLQAA